MLKENIKNLRKAKGMSQEELAIKLHVVRQSVSKWERGLSVPDSEMLLQIAEKLDTTVAALLGETMLPEGDTELSSLAAKLESINEQLAKRKEGRRKIWRTFFVLACILAIMALGKEAIDFFYHSYVMAEMTANHSVIGGNEGSTGIFVATPIWTVFFPILAITVCAVGLYKTRK